MDGPAPGPLRWDGEGWAPPGSGPCPREAPVAIVIDGSVQAVLMATPSDLGELALGFALTEGLIAGPADVAVIEEGAAPAAQGIGAHEARLWLRPGLAAALAGALARRRRTMAGPVGCGLCGIEGIAEALPPVLPVEADWQMEPADVARAMQALSRGQVLRRANPAIHGAAFWDGSRAIVREDVGRHNALDKLAGALAQAGVDRGQGAVVMSSRLSVDLVQKTARIGCPVLIGASAPTDLAVDWAHRAGITLLARAREGGFEVHTHPRRIAGSRENPRPGENP